MLAVAGVVLGVAAEWWLPTLIGVGGAFVVGLATAILYDDPVTGAVEQNGRWVRLRGTHPAFDAAVTRQPAPRTSF